MRLRKTKWQAIFGILAIFVVWVSISGCGLSESNTSGVGSEVGDVAPDFAFPTIDGQTVQLSKLRGQPVLVNFWITSCHPCRDEMTYIQAAFEEKGNEVKFIAVNLEESLETVRQFAEEMGLSFTIALDSKGESKKTYNVGGIPHTVIIDEQGIIRHIRIAAFQDKDEILSLLESL